MPKDKGWIKSSRRFGRRANNLAVGKYADGLADVGRQRQRGVFAYKRARKGRERTDAVAIKDEGRGRMEIGKHPGSVGEKLSVGGDAVMLWGEEGKKREWGRQRPGES